MEAGTKATLESIFEYIYPTEYEPPAGLPNLPEKAPEEETPVDKLTKKVNKLAFPTAFETRNTGTTLEFEITPVQGDEKLWDLRLAPEVVAVAGMDEWGPEGIRSTMPRFTCYRTSSGFRVTEGQWSLVSMQSPFHEDERLLEKKRLTFVKIQRAR